MMMLTSAFYYHGKTLSIMGQNSFWSRILTWSYACYNKKTAHKARNSTLLFGSCAMGCLHQGEIKRRSLTWYTARSLCPPFVKVGPYCLSSKFSNFLPTLSCITFQNSNMFPILCTHKFLIFFLHLWGVSQFQNPGILQCFGHLF